MDLDWIIQEPIDFEYKQYLILDYVKKAEEKLDRFELYPTFQELAIHFASMSRVKDHGQIITLKELPEEVDDEILITDLIYNTILYNSMEDRESILYTAEYANEKFKDLFMMAKSLWSVVNDSINLELKNNLDNAKGGWGYFYFIYESELHIYEFSLRKLKPTTQENKCYFTKIYQGEVRSVETLILENYHKGYNATYFMEHHSDDSSEILLRPIFKVSFTQSFPLEGSLLSLSRRKVMNYIFQSIKIKELKEQ